MKTLFKDKKWWKDTLKFIGIGIVINVFCFFVCAFTGHCANIDDLQFPYYINETYGANGNYGNNVIDTDNVNDIYDTYFRQFEDTYLSSLYTYGEISTDDVILCRVSEISNNLGNSSPRLACTLIVYVNPVCNTNILNNSSFVNTSVSISCEKAFRYQLNFFPNNNSFTHSGNGFLSSSGLNYNFFGTPSIYHLNYTKPSTQQHWEGYQIYNYPLIMKGTNIFYSANNIPIIAFTGVSIGDFTNLPNLDSLLDNITNTWEPPSTTTGHALPSTPQENTNNTPFQDRLQMFQYLADTITQNFGNLGYNLQNFFNKIQQKLTDVANSISQNIYNGFKTLMDNVKDFFGPKLDKIIDLLSQFTNNATTDFNENWDNSQVKQDFDSISQSVETSFTVWSNTSEPNEFKIPLHVENVAILHCNQVQYIDLGLFSPVLPYIRTIMWALMVYSLVYTIIDSLASYISGGDE